MVRRLIVTAALIVSAATAVTACTPTHPGCYMIRFGGTAPGDWVYISENFQWITVIAGQIYVMGYSRTIDSNIYNLYYCVPQSASNAPNNAT